MQANLKLQLSRKSFQPNFTKPTLKHVLKTLKFELTKVTEVRPVLVKPVN